MVSVKNVLLLATGALAVAIPRDVSTILSDLATIDSKVLAVETALNNYVGLNTSFPVDMALFGLYGAVNDATNHVSNSASVSEAETHEVVDYVDSTLQPDIKATIDELLVKAPIFKQNGEGGIAYLYSTSLKDATKKYASTLLAKAPASAQAAGQAALQTIIDQIDRAVAVFKS